MCVKLYLHYKKDAVSENLYEEMILKNNLIYFYAEINFFLSFFYLQLISLEYVKTLF